MNTALIKPEWSPLTVALMVLGFVVFWPLGLAVLAYILWGEYMGGSREQAESWLKAQKKSCKSYGKHYRGGHRATGNAAFDEYRDEQLKRLEEERRRLDEERQAFAEYLDNLHKARDRDEFDRFMRDRKGGQGTTENGDQPSWN